MIRVFGELGFGEMEHNQRDNRRAGVAEKQRDVYVMYDMWTTENVLDARKITKIHAANVLIFCRALYSILSSCCCFLPYPPVTLND